MGKVIFMKSEKPSTFHGGFIQVMAHLNREDGSEIQVEND